MINKNKLGLFLGLVLAFMHVLWSIAVGLGAAERLVNFSFRMHMVQPAFTIMEFSLGKAVGLVIVAFVVGCVLGWIFGAIWNWVEKK